MDAQRERLLGEHSFGKLLKSSCPYHRSHPHRLTSEKHVASTSPSLEVLRILLLKGASVHMRNNAGRTPLFLAANAGLDDHVELLRQSGAHLHAEEVAQAKLRALQDETSSWYRAGI